MTQVVFDSSVFRALFPEFSDGSQFTDDCLQLYWDQATCYISDQTNSCLDEKCLTLLINYMTAHILKISEASSMGGDTALVESSKIGDVSVSAAIPNIDDQFAWWINQTPYGKQYYALLSSKIAGGFYAGASLDIQAFRGASGLFNA